MTPEGRRIVASPHPLASTQTFEKTMRITLPLALLILAGAAEAAETEFLFDVLHGRTAYHASWDRLMKTVQPTPDWLAQFNKDFDGVSGQIAGVTVDGKPYELSFVCKPTDCAGHKFVVLFDANGAHAFGALGGKDTDPEFFGKPSPAEQEAMAKAVKE
jgi:Inhibitor of vertebrate lysozyme (Ivy)